MPRLSHGVTAAAVAVSLALGGLAAVAQTSTPPTGPGRGQQKREERREERQEKKEERKIKLADRRKANIRRHFNKMIQRFEQRLGKLKQLADRIETRIKALNTQGADTAAAKAELTAARASWQKAKDAIAAAKAKLEGVLASEAPRESFRELKALLNQIKDHVKQTHAYLVRAITKIRGLRVGRPEGKPVPTTTPTSTPPVTPPPTTTPTATPTSTPTSTNP